MLDRFTQRLNQPEEFSDTGEQGPRGRRASAIELVPIERIFGSVMVMRDGSFRSVLKAGSVNTDLLTDAETLDVYDAFGQLLNTLTPDFPLQIIAHAEQMDTRRYASHLERRLQSELSPEMRHVMLCHLEHYERQAQENFLLDRSIYVVIPYYLPGRSTTAATAGIAGDLPGGGILKAFDGGELPRYTPTSMQIEQARTRLDNRVAVVANALKRAGIESELLDELGLVRMEREFYNPGVSQAQTLQGYDPSGFDIGDIQIEMGERTRGFADGPSLQPGTGGRTR